MSKKEKTGIVVHSLEELKQLIEQRGGYDVSDNSGGGVGCSMS